MPDRTYDYVADGFSQFSDAGSQLTEAGISAIGRFQIVQNQALTIPKDREGLHRFLSNQLGGRGELQIAIPAEGGPRYGPRWDFLLVNALLNRGITVQAAQQVWQN